MKKHFLLSFISLCILIGYKLWAGETLLSWINSTFLVGIIALMAAAIMNIWKTGFLTLLTDGFKLIGNTIIPKTRSAERADNLMKNDHSLNQWKHDVAKWISYICTNFAIISLTVSLVSLIGYYQ